MRRGSEDTRRRTITQRVAEALATHGIGAIADMVVFFDRAAEKELRDEALSGAFGEIIKTQVLIRGQRAAFPRFSGFTLVWDHPVFIIKFIETLTLEEMRQVVRAQQNAMDALAQNQRRF